MGGTINLHAKESLTGKNGSLSDSLPAVLPPINTKLGAVELTLLQQLGNSTLSTMLPCDHNFSIDGAWARVERTLRNYTQYHLDCSLRSATFLDSLAILDF
jgi:DNA repair protein RecO (recombination protein O)